MSEHIIEALGLSKVTIKDMESGEQELIAIKNIVTYLKGE